LAQIVERRGPRRLRRDSADDCEPDAKFFAGAILDAMGRKADITPMSQNQRFGPILLKKSAINSR
jgi:hypothetical protein